MIVFKSHEVFQIAARFLSRDPLIVEAGAFNGSDTIRLAKQWPHGKLHSFEPVPELFKKLKQAIASYPNVICYNMALSNQTGMAIFHLSEKLSKPGFSSQAGSLLAPKERLKHSTMQFPRTITVPTITLDDWAKQYEISHIDFLWLDMQGPELSVMKTSKEVMKTVKLIYCEVAYQERYVGQPQVDEVTDWLESQGFELVGQDYEGIPKDFYGNRLFHRML